MHLGICILPTGSPFGGFEKWGGSHTLTKEHWILKIILALWLLFSFLFASLQNSWQFVAECAVNSYFQCYELRILITESLVCCPELIYWNMSQSSIHFLALCQAWWATFASWVFFPQRVTLDTHGWWALPCSIFNFLSDSGTVISQTLMGSNTAFEHHLPPVISAGLNLWMIS